MPTRPRSVQQIISIFAISLALFASAETCRSQTFGIRNPEYVLHRGDVLDVRYRYTPEFNQLVTVRPDDRVTLLNLGTVETTGLTVSQFKERVVVLSRSQLVNPEVTILLREFETQHIFVEGEVTTPGRFELRSDVSVLDAIAMAGGFKPSSAKSKVLLLHQPSGGGQTVTTALDLNKLISDKKMEEAVQVHSGDVIYVTQNSLSKVERLLRMGQLGAIYNPAH